MRRVGGGEGGEGKENLISFVLPGGKGGKYGSRSREAVRKDSMGRKAGMREQRELYGRGIGGEIIPSIYKLLKQSRGKGKLTTGIILRKGCSELGDFKGGGKNVERET